MIQSIKTFIPFFAGLIPAGFPSPAADYVQEEIDLNKFLKGNSSATFIIRVQGDSMIGAHITNNSLLIVDRSKKAVHNSIVVASINGEFTIKRLSLINKSVRLVPANPSYKPVLITEDTQFEVWGVVTNIIISTKDI